MAIMTEIKGDKLIITVDCSPSARAAAPLSKSEKTKLLATTGGFTRVGDMGVSLNVTVAKA